MVASAEVTRSDASRAGKRPIAKADRVEVEAVVEGAQRGMSEKNDGSWSKLFCGGARSTRTAMTILIENRGWCVGARSARR